MSLVSANLPALHAAASLVTLLCLVGLLLWNRLGGSRVIRNDGLREIRSGLFRRAFLETDRPGVIPIPVDARRRPTADDGVADLPADPVQSVARARCFRPGPDPRT